jgi:hypothetical protein
MDKIFFKIYCFIPNYALEITKGGLISLALENKPSSQARFFPLTDNFNTFCLE